MNLDVIVKNRWIDILRRSFADWMEDKALRLSAALAYYSIFSIAPLLVIAIGIAGLVFDREAVSGQLYGELRNYVGAQSAEALQSMVQSASKPAQSTLAAIIGFVTLLFGASGVFGQLKDALNTIWEVEPKPGTGFMSFLREKILNFGMVLVIGFLLLVSLTLSAAIAGLNHHLDEMLNLPAFVWATIAFVISLGIVATLFAMIFKVMPDVKVGWRDVWIGAVITAVLFEIGKTGLSWYLGREGTASAYGAAGSVILLLLWVYYTSCILLFGAEFTQVYAQASGRVIAPADKAQRVSDEDRAQQGLTPDPSAPQEGRIPGVTDAPSGKVARQDPTTDWALDRARNEPAALRFQSGLTDGSSAAHQQRMVTSLALAFATGIGLGIAILATRRSR
ncbi:MAG: YihY/virulence factor BrkB family protein [Verrucomicrobiaceae bacterium]|nr:MAG: YihY/virulence factor BrkB family protein [Verrucomicrobiaceae bacterium]